MISARGAGTTAIERSLRRGEDVIHAVASTANIVANAYDATLCSKIMRAHSSITLKANAKFERSVWAAPATRNCELVESATLGWATRTSTV